MLLGIIDALWARVGPYMAINWGEKGHHTSVIQSHRLMYEALSRRDKEKLKELLAEDLRVAARTIIPLLQDAAPEARSNTIKKDRLIKRQPAESTLDPRRR